MNATTYTSCHLHLNYITYLSDSESGGNRRLSYELNFILNIYQMSQKGLRLKSIQHIDELFLTFSTHKFNDACRKITPFQQIP